MRIFGWKLKVNVKILTSLLLCISILVQACILVGALGSREKFSQTECFSMPFYGLSPKPITLRANFSTDYAKSSQERKHNIKLATNAINNTLLDIGEEFSFNQVVGRRTEKRGYKSAKIIENGAFVDGVGGGVCQVSTTLYNAVLLAGLKITEYHPHSLPISYVEPSFDAMVNSGSADLKFANNTKNPIIIKAFATENSLTITIYGEPMACKYQRKSEIVEVIAVPPAERVEDVDLEYPNLLEGETLIIKYGTQGIKSKGYLVKIEKGKVKEEKLIRKDVYKATKGIIIEGKAKPNQIEIETPQVDT